MTRPTSVLRLLLLCLPLMWAMPWILACAGDNTEGEDVDCQVGAEGCSCTQGGGCDPSLVCLSNLCVSPGDDDGDVDSGTLMSSDAGSPVADAGNPGNGDGDGDGGSSIADAGTPIEDGGDQDNNDDGE